MPITVADAKRHLRIDAADVNDDDYIGSLIKTAETHIERETFIVTSKRSGEPFLFDCFDDELVLPRGPVDTATIDIKFIGIDGTEQDLALGAYRQVTNRLITRLYPPIGGRWPQFKRVPSGISVTADVGYVEATDVAPSLCSEALKQAARLLVGHWYVNREAVIAARSVVPAEMPFAVTLLLEGERLWLSPIA